MLRRKLVLAILDLMQCNAYAYWCKYATIVCNMESRALLAPENEKALRGFKLKTFPADSWHQPAEDADGHVHWRPRAPRQNSATLSPAPEVSSGILVFYI